MSILCCRRNSSTLAPKPVIQPPKILLGLATPLPQTSRQNIEAFYNEGKQLFQARQEESKRSSLQAAVQEAYGTSAIDRADSELSKDEGAQMGISNQNPVVSIHRLTGNVSSTQLSSKSSPAGELHPSVVSASLITGNSRQTIASGRSMPALAGMLPSGTAGSDPQPIPSGTTRYPGLATSISMPTIMNLPIETAVLKIPTSLGVSPVNMPSTPGLNPYMMPSIATTIASINEGSEATPLTAGCGVRNSSKSPVRNPRNGGAGAGLDGTIVETGRAIPAALKTPNNIKQRDTSSETAASEECFTPNEFFSRIPAWVKPSTSTFMSFPSCPDSNRPEGLDTSLSTGSTTPDLAKSISSKFYSPPETAGAGNSGASTPAFLYPPTPAYQFRPSIDNTSSFYPSRETSRCQSPVGSIGNPLELSDIPTPTAVAAARILIRTPQPLHRLNTMDSVGYSAFRFGWKNRSSIKSPEPITNEDAFIRSSSLAHLKKAQKRVNMANLISKSSHPESPFPQETSEAFHFQERTRMSSFPMPDGIVRDSRNWAPSRTWESGTSKGNTFSNFGKNEKKFSLRNSVSLGERMWERPSARNSGQERLRRTTMANGLAGPTSDLGHEEENGCQRSRRAMIRSRSMTLRRTFTNSIAKLRGKVSFSGSSKATVVSPSPLGKPVNKDHFYQTRHGEQNPAVYAPDALNEKNKQDASGSDMSSIIFRPTLPKKMLERESSREFSKDTSPGNGDIITRRSGLGLHLNPTGVSTPPNSDSCTQTSAGQSAFDTATEGPSRRWSTLYDDCVAFPFTEGDVGSDSELETPVSGFFNTREKNRAKQIWRDARETMDVVVTN